MLCQTKNTHEYLKLIFNLVDNKNKKYSEKCRKKINKATILRNFFTIKRNLFTIYKQVNFTQYNNIDTIFF